MSIELKQVSCSYNFRTKQEILALNGISMKIEDGEFVGIMGHTGSGKSTLVQLIAGLIRPNSGQVFLDGKDINERGYDRNNLHRQVGIVFQNPEYQLFETTVAKDVAFGLKHSGLRKEEACERVRQALEQMGFSYDDIADASPFALSGGEKRRVAIAGVLAARPKTLIFDEPIAGLDPEGRRQFLELVRKLNREGVSILMVSHHADSICACAERVLVLEQGSLVLDGSPKAVFADLERTSRLHIGASQPRQIAELLIQSGIPFSRDIVRYEDLLDELKNRWKGGTRCE